MEYNSKSSCSSTKEKAVILLKRFNWGDDSREMATGSGDRKRRRSFRNGLYQALEAEIREAHEDTSCGRLDPRRCCRTECGRKGLEDHETTDRVDYPFPILWFEEMTPEDLDLYHLNCKMFASNVNESVAVNSTSVSDGSGHKLSMSSAFAAAQGATSGETSTSRKPGMNRVGLATKLAPLKRKLCATMGANKTESDGSVSRNSTGQSSDEGVPPTRSPTTLAATLEMEIPNELDQTRHLEKEESHSPAPILEKTVPTGSLNQSDQTSVQLLPCGSSTTPTAVHPKQTHETQETGSATALAGLPSQVQVTFQSNEDPWCDMEDNMEVQHSSEYSIGRTHALDLPQLSPETAPDSGATNEHEPQVRLEIERDAPSRLQSREERTRLYETFAEGVVGSMSYLDDPAREKSEAQGGRAGTQEEGAGHRGGFVVVPITDVLPRGLPGGQNGLIALLEDHLARVTNKTPNGYVARALELACHVLRQPKACVRVRPQDARNASDAGHGNAVSPREAYDGYTEVLGVPEIVWEIVRTSSTWDAQLDGQKHR